MAAGTRRKKKGKEGTKSDDSFPQRGYEINPKVAKKVGGQLKTVSEVKKRLTNLWRALDKSNRQETG